VHGEDDAAAMARRCQINVETANRVEGELPIAHTGPTPNADRSGERQWPDGLQAALRRPFAGRTFCSWAHRISQAREALVTKWQIELTRALKLMQVRSGH